MKHIVGIASWSLGSLILIQGIGSPARSQSISPATDGTGTVVTQTGNRFDINGGTQAGSNLYQSFQRFGLNQNQIANFLSNPSIQNILGRVVGGDPSVINGLLQVTGSNANLFLVNPAGIVFGSSASLNVPASFTATTANGIQVGSQWFGVNTTADGLSALTGNPNAFAFTATQPGAIFNAGNLAVSPGQSLTLVGGAVLNTGTLTAPGGTIMIAAVPGEKLVRLSPAGGVLSLDLPLDTKTALSANAQPITPLSLPALLVRSSIPVATGVSVENGVVTLTNSGLSVPTDPGTAIASGTFDTSGSQTGGTVNVLGSKVGLVSANINASGSTGGGTVLIGGEYQGRGAVTNASRTFVSSDSVIRADALTSGNGGRVIVWADDATQFLGTISARGGRQAGNGGFVEVSGKQNLQYLGTVDTSAPNGNFGTLLLDPADITITPGGAADGFTGSVLAGDAGPSTLTQNQLQSLPGNTNVRIEATNTITIQPLGTLSFAAGSGSITFQAGGAFTMSAGDVIQAPGRSITITAANIAAGGIFTGSLQGFASPLNAGSIAGNISLTATSGTITARYLESNYAGISGVNGRGGNITLNAPGDIRITRYIDVRSLNPNPIPSLGGSITVNGVLQNTSYFPSALGGVTFRGSATPGSSSSGNPTSGSTGAPITPSSIDAATPLVNAGIQFLSNTPSSLTANPAFNDPNLSRALALATFGTSLSDSAAISDLTFEIARGNRTFVEGLTGITGPTVNLETNLIIANSNRAAQVGFNALRDTMRDLQNGSTSAPGSQTGSNSTFPFPNDGIPIPGDPDFNFKFVRNNFDPKRGF